ncbi:MAG: hypothetical protein WBA07_22730 [Rivularia sp. (in: cyanobacteria)]
MFNRMRAVTFAAFMLATVSSAFTILPLAANAQFNSNAPQKVSQARGQNLPNLQLSQQQINAITEIRSKTRTQIQNVLTAQQRQKIQDDLQVGKNPQQVFASIQFTQQQQNQLQTIMLYSQKQMESVLTPAQKRTLLQWRANQSNENRTADSSNTMDQFNHQMRMLRTFSNTMGYGMDYNP